MPLTRAGARTESTTCYSYNVRRGQFPHMHIGIVHKELDARYAFALRVLHFSALHFYQLHFVIPGPLHPITTHPARSQSGSLLSNLHLKIHHMKKEFIVIKKATRNAIKNKRVAAVYLIDKLQVTFVQLNPVPHNIRTIFQRLKFDLDYLHPDVYDYIIQEFGLNINRNKVIGTYKQSLNEFLENTPLIEFGKLSEPLKIPDHTPNVLELQITLKRKNVKLVSIESLRIDLVKECNAEPYAITIASIDTTADFVITVLVSKAVQLPAFSDEFRSRHRIIHISSCLETVRSRATRLSQTFTPQQSTGAFCELPSTVSESTDALSTDAEHPESPLTASGLFLASSTDEASLAASGSHQNSPSGSPESSKVSFQISPSGSSESLIAASRQISHSGPSESSEAAHQALQISRSGSSAAPRQALLISYFGSSESSVAVSGSLQKFGNTVSIATANMVCMAILDYYDT